MTKKKRVSNLETHLKEVQLLLVILDEHLGYLRTFAKDAFQETEACRKAIEKKK